MKLYANATGSSCRRVSVYLAEKGLQVERVEVDLGAGEHRRPEFLAKNPAGKIPVLELEDGSCVPESAAIVEVLEELHPEPSMIGRTPAQRGQVRALERIANDLIVLSEVMLQHGLPLFASRVQQIPGVAEALRPKVNEQLALLEQHIGSKPFLASDRPTIADCTLFSLFQACRARWKFPFGEGYPHLEAWYERFAQRPSAAYQGVAK
jgi:glutathione S-transferase